MSGALAQCVAPNARLRLLADGFGFTEGPAADANGNVFFVDIGNHRVHYWNVEYGLLTIIREDSGGADGMFVDADGALWICEMGARRIARIGRDGAYRVVVDAYEGEPFTGPNDLWFDDQGGLYFTDSYPGHSDRGHTTRVFYLSPKGELRLLADDYAKSNGLHGSPDGRWLYVADYLDDRIYRYFIAAPGKLADRTLFCEVRCDGMTVDERGNLYLCTGNYGQGVVVVDPEGRMCGTIEVAEDAHNICFGGPNYSTLYIAATHGLYALDMQVRGTANGSPRRITRDFGGLDKLIGKRL